MSKEKNKNTFRVAALLLVACLISSVMLSGTFAKYTSEYSGQDTALVARWSFAADSGGTALAASPGSQELALFDHLYDTHMNQKAADGTTFIIAPGVSDEFVLDMDYIADVDADVEITIEELAGNTAHPPIEYSADGGITWVALGDLAEEYIEQIIATGITGITDPTADDNTFRIAKVANDSIDDVNISETIMWRWPYEASEAVHAGSTNATDTALGEDSNDEGLTRTSYGIKVTVKATQVTPTTDGPISFTGMGPISVVGQTLTAGTITPTDATVSYQWQKSDDGIAFINIDDQITNQYVVGGSDEGSYIRVVATGTGGTYTGTVTSAPVGPIAAAD